MAIQSGSSSNIEHGQVGSVQTLPYKREISDEDIENLSRKVDAVTERIKSQDQQIEQLTAERDTALKRAVTAEASVKYLVSRMESLLLPPAQLNGLSATVVDLTQSVAQLRASAS